MFEECFVLVNVGLRLVGSDARQYAVGKQETQTQRQRVTLCW